ncbi:MAG: D-alanine--D-alanine ligase [Coriobacteriales bacterium]|jgi:D-alanine-D-alanine ligase|nr:D-alanine--D-alanine ligase [Coriobacteriales bacterium]
MISNLYDNAEADPNAEAELKSEVEVDTDPEDEAELESEVEVEADPNVEAEPEQETASDLEPEAEEQPVDETQSPPAPSAYQTQVPPASLPSASAPSTSKTPAPAVQTPVTPRRRIALLAGGTSGEREVSLASGQNAAQALTDAGHQVEIIDTIDPGFIHTLIEIQPDVVFIALHGRDGEDGRIQGLLELLRLPYTGSGVLASSLAMDKCQSKVFYRNAGIQAPDCVQITHTMIGLQAAQDFVTRYGLPCVVKPTDEGSSLGISIVRDMTDLAWALDLGFKYSRSILVERFIAGVEVTVPVIGNDELIALPVIEIVPVVSDFYDYEAKYSEGGSNHIIPARLSPSLLEYVQEQALKAHQVLGCMGMSRSDFIVDALGTAWIIETNTIPGMTSLSLLPDSARHAGIEAGDLYTRIVEWGIEAHSYR